MFNSFSRTRKRFKASLLSLGLGLILTLGLVACGEANPTALTTATPTTAPVMTVTATTPASTAASGAATESNSGATSAEMTADNNVESEAQVMSDFDSLNDLRYTGSGRISKPIIIFSASTLKIGDVLTVRGRFFPANRTLFVRLGKNFVEVPGAYPYAHTDAQGNFTTKLKLDRYTDYKPLQAGKILLSVMTVGTTANQPGASAYLNLKAS